MASSLYRNGGKRVLDLALAGPGFLLALPLLAVLALLTRVFVGSPVLFRQTRPGLRGAPFTLFKFRTMRDVPGLDRSPLSDEQRLTRFGRILRAASLDELPELINVLRGEMSLVGPRPLLTRYLERYSPRQARRHEVRPGITGWAQVRGRNLLSWEERFEADVWYVDHVGLWLDLRILARTVGSVLKREGISAEGHATMPEFMGTRERDSG